MGPDAAEKQRALLQEELDSFVAELFDGYVPNPQNTGDRRDGKVIRDPIHGFLHLDPWEVEVLDSPLVQRLRYIHQNALAYLVYPSATHTRFEHSLGVTKVVHDVALAYREGHPDGKLFDSSIEREIRLAALLHDVGHGIFSHLSESLIKNRWYDDFSTLESLPLFRGKAAGEILSYMLITSNPFKEFLNEIILRHHLPVNANRIAGYVLGHTEDPSLEAYKADLITGPLDADKLDYLARDCYFTGIRSEVDIPQIIRSLGVWEKGGSFGRTLLVTLRGASFVEQMHFARLLLYPAMYHHQKIRATESMVLGIFETIWKNSTAIHEPKMKFQKITDFFNVSEGEFLALGLREEVLRPKIRRLVNRTLPRRALHISSSVVEGSPEDTDYSDLVKLGDGKPGDKAEIQEIRQEIFDSLPIEARREIRGDAPLDVDDLWLDVPPTPKVSSDIMRCFVDTNEDEPKSLRELFPVDAWLQSYAENKWVWHVFGYPFDDPHLKAINRQAINVLESRFKVKFRPRASLECKLFPPS